MIPAVLVLALLAVLSPVRAFPQALAPAAGPPGVGAAGFDPAALDLASMQELERQLQAAGFDPGRVDGVIDRRTRDAVRDYQQAKGLPVSGDLDHATQAALLAEGANVSTPMDGSDGEKGAPRK